MADDCGTLVRLFIEGYVDEPTRYMVKWTATPLRPASVKLAAYEFLLRSDDGAIDWYTNGSWTGGIAVEVGTEYSTPQFRPGMTLTATLRVSFFGAGDVCERVETIRIPS